MKKNLEIHFRDMRSRDLNTRFQISRTWLEIHTLEIFFRLEIRYLDILFLSRDKSRIGNLEITIWSRNKILNLGSKKLVPRDIFFISRFEISSFFFNLEKNLEKTISRCKSRDHKSHHKKIKLTSGSNSTSRDFGSRN